MGQISGPEVEPAVREGIKRQTIADAACNTTCGGLKSLIR
jgi:hypothetical protein